MGSELAISRSSKDGEDSVWAFRDSQKITGTSNPIINAALGLNTTGTGTTTIGSATAGALTLLGNTSINTTGTRTTTIGSATAGATLLGNTSINTTGTGTTTIGSATSGTVMLTAPTLRLNTTGTGVTLIGTSGPVTINSTAAGINTTGTGTTTIGSATAGDVTLKSPTISINTTGTGTTTIGSATSGTTFNGAVAGLSTYGVFQNALGAATPLAIAVTPTPAPLTVTVVSGGGPSVNPSNYEINLTKSGIYRVVANLTFSNSGTADSAVECFIYYVSPVSSDTRSFRSFPVRHPMSPATIAYTSCTYSATINYTTALGRLQFVMAAPTGATLALVPLTDASGGSYLPSIDISFERIIA
jgi:hypothetical protein